MHAEDERFMRLALELADRAGAAGEVPVGAIVVEGGRVVGAGHNRREADSDPTAHAELLAIREASRSLSSWRLDQATLYVTLEPCAMCAGAIVLSRIPRCVFGCSDPKGGFVGTLGDLSAWPGLNHRFEVQRGVLEAECRQRLQLFFQGLREQRKGRV